MSSVAPGAASRPALNPWIVAIAVVIPTFMEVLDTTIANVALRYIAGGISAFTSRVSASSSTHSTQRSTTSPGRARPSSSSRPATLLCPSASPPIPALTIAFSENSFLSRGNAGRALKKNCIEKVIVPRQPDGAGR